MCVESFLMGDAQGVKRVNISTMRTSSHVSKRKEDLAADPSELEGVEWVAHVDLHTLMS